MEEIIPQSLNTHILTPLSQELNKKCDGTKLSINVLKLNLWANGVRHFAGELTGPPGV